MRGLGDEEKDLRCNHQPRGGREVNLEAHSRDGAPSPLKPVRGWVTKKRTNGRHRGKKYTFFLGLGVSFGFCPFLFARLWWFAGRFVGVWRVWSFLCRLSAVLGLGRSLGLVGLLAPVSFGFVAVRRGLAFPFLLAWSAAASGRCRPFEEEEEYPLLGWLRSGVGGRVGRCAAAPPRTSPRTPCRKAPAAPPAAAATQSGVLVGAVPSGV